MKNTLIQILGFSMMSLGIFGAVRQAANDDPGLLSWLAVDASLIIAINVVVAIVGIALLRYGHDKATKSAK